MVTGYHHLSLTVRDLQASVSWYADLFGLQKMMDEPHEGGRAVVLVHPGAGWAIGLHGHDTNDGRTFHETRTGLDHLSFAVADRDALRAWQETFAAKGIVHSPIADRPWGSVLVFRDPDNIQLELCAPPAA
jgi:glyoxylase I family protein